MAMTPPPMTSNEGPSRRFDKVMEERGSLSMVPEEKDSDCEARGPKKRAFCEQMMEM